MITIIQFMLIELADEFYVPIITNLRYMAHQYLIAIITTL